MARKFEYEFPTRYSASRRGYVVGVDCSGDKPLTVQSDKDACDINKIMARYQKTGELPPGLQNGNYGDFSEVGEYHDALVRIEQARAQFMALPAKVRERFGHNPARMLAFVADKANLEEAYSLGMLSEEYTKARLAKEAADKAAVAEGERVFAEKISKAVEAAVRLS